MLLLSFGFGVVAIAAGLSAPATPGPSTRVRLRGRARRPRPGRDWLRGGSASGDWRARLPVERATRQPGREAARPRPEPEQAAAEAMEWNSLLMLLEAAEYLERRERGAPRGARRGERAGEREGSGPL